VMTPLVAVAPIGRITAHDAGMYDPDQQQAWSATIAALRQHHPQTRLGITLNHAGRRGSMQSRTRGLDLPLRAGGWATVAPTALPYTHAGVVPVALDAAGMERTRDDFVRATRMAAEAGFDLLQLHAAHGYLLASFLSPLTNFRDDEYGGSRANRMRFPLEIVDAVRAAWPQARPLALALTVTDGERGGISVDDGVAMARSFGEHGCALITVMAGQTTPHATPSYRRGFLTPLADRIRNEANVVTMVGGYLLGANEANTLLAAGRADLCMLEYPWPEPSADSTVRPTSSELQAEARSGRPANRRGEKHLKQEARHGR
jgi:anthraniloyl-CoA monooxygenase